MVRTNESGRYGPPKRGLGEGPTTLPRKKEAVTKPQSEPRIPDGTNDDGRNKRKMDMIFGTWNTRSLFRSGALCEGSIEGDDKI